MARTFGRKPQISLPIAWGPEDAPRVRGDCANVQRPCRWVSCKYHLHGVTLRPGRRWYDGHDPDERVRAHSDETCALDCADRGAMDRDATAKVSGMSSECVRLIEEIGKERLLLVTSFDEHDEGVCRDGCALCEYGVA